MSILKNRPYDGWSNIDDFLREGQLTKVSEELSKQVKGYLDVTSPILSWTQSYWLGILESELAVFYLVKNKENVMVIGRRFEVSVNEFLIVRLNKKAEQATVLFGLKRRAKLLPVVSYLVKRTSVIWQLMHKGVEPYYYCRHRIP